MVRRERVHPESQAKYLRKRRSETRPCTSSRETIRPQAQCDMADGVTRRHILRPEVFVTQALLPRAVHPHGKHVSNPTCVDQPHPTGRSCGVTLDEKARRGSLTPWCLLLGERRRSNYMVLPHEYLCMLHAFYPTSAGATIHAVQASAAAATRK